MAQTKSKRQSTSSSRTRKPAAATRTSAAAKKKKPVRREVGAVVFLLLGIFSLIGYFSTNGIFIEFFSHLLKGFFGWGFYAAPPVMFLCAVILAFHRGRSVRLRIICALFLPMAIGALCHLFIDTDPVKISAAMFKELWNAGIVVQSGGALGGALSEVFTYLFSSVGAGIVLVCASLLLLLVSLNKTIFGVVDALRRRAKEERTVIPYDEPEAYDARSAMMTNKNKVIDIPMDEPKSRRKSNPLKTKNQKPFFNDQPGVPSPDEVLQSDTSSAPTDDAAPAVDPTQPIVDVPLDIPFMEKRPTKNTVKPTPEKINDTASTDVSKSEPIAVDPVKTDSGASKSTYAYPPLDLLSHGPTVSRTDGSDEIRLNIERLQSSFRSFGVNVHVTSYTRGPTVTRYEAELEAGVKLNRLTSLADDIALSLGSNGVRIAAMPNKISTVGIEVPNKLVSMVALRQIIDSPEFKKASSKLTFAIGKNIGGEAIVGDISKLPHMLVAGTTGSGKSVCLNSLILSILYKATPEEVRFIMIDPKMVEFRVYNGIPHLLVPVVTEVKKASGALQWAVVEMMKRYRLFSESNARDLVSYNKVMQSTEDGVRLPQIIIVIDELADLMLTAAKEVEESVCRVAQMGRAAGVHLVIATQSPRADVITGLMKANIPSRISLKVSSALESRIILDAGGNADKLVGNGDMLFAPIGSSKPIRIQGTWVSDTEREKVVEFIKQSGAPQYSQEIISEIEKAAEEKSGDNKKAASTNASDYDDLLPQAVDVILDSGQASVSMLQRRLKLGYSRAARIVDQMEQLKIVGPFEGSKPRQLLVTRQQWYEMQYVQGTAPPVSNMVEDTVSEAPTQDNAE